MLTAEQILALDDLPRKEVFVAEWNTAVFIRTMTAGERDAWEAAVTRSRDKDVRARLIAQTVCDADGKLLFTREQIPALSAKSGVALSRLFDAAIKLNRVLPADVAELEKNSDASPSDGSSSSSPGT
jgi:hypothetical protein